MYLVFRLLLILSNSHMLGEDGNADRTDTFCCSRCSAKFLAEGDRMWRGVQMVVGGRTYWACGQQIRSSRSCMCWCCEIGRGSASASGCHGSMPHPPTSCQRLLADGCKTGRWAACRLRHGKNNSFCQSKKADQDGGNSQAQAFHRGLEAAPEATCEVMRGKSSIYDWRTSKEWFIL